MIGELWHTQIYASARVCFGLSITKEINKQIFAWTDGHFFLRHRYPAEEGFRQLENLFLEVKLWP